MAAFDALYRGFGAPDTAARSVTARRRNRRKK
jgi:hypothetical protein